MTQEEALRRFLIVVKNKLLDRVPIATGATAENIEYKVEGKGRYGHISVPHWMYALESGRGPSRGGGYMGFDKAILKWMQAVGFSGEVSKRSAFAVARSINMHGSGLYKRGGGSGVLTGWWRDIQDDLLELSKVIGNEQARAYADQLRRIITKEQ